MTTLSASSITAYEKRVEHLRTMDPPIDFANPADTIAKLHASGKSPSTVKSYISAILYSIGKTAEGADAYRAEIKRIADELKAISEKQELTETEKSKYMAWPDIVKASETILSNSAITEMDKLLCAFYTMIPPVRNDYARLTLYKKVPKIDVGNYAVVKKKDAYIKINEHKTAKSSGALTLPIPPALYKRLQTFMLANPAVTTLFDYDEKELSRHIIRLFQNTTGKAVGVNVLRHSFITHEFAGEKALLEKKDIAKSMAHSIASQQLYRRIAKPMPSPTPDAPTVSAL